MQGEGLALKMCYPRSVDEALNELSVEHTVAVAGATWVMRTPLRHEGMPKRFIALSKIEHFYGLDLLSDFLTIGPMLTHDQIARRLPKFPEFDVLRQAASYAANPGVRRIATIGGNISTYDFAASDLASALLALDTTIKVAQLSGEREMTIEDFLAQRTTLKRPWLVTAISIKRGSSRASAHQRLPMRRAGDYPAAILSASATVDGKWRVGVGSVEDQPRRWYTLEKALGGLNSFQAEQAARDLVCEFSGRETPGIPGWYRTNVLPVLVRRAVSAIGGHDIGEI